jgi:hypothetical protein
MTHAIKYLNSLNRHVTQIIISNKCLTELPYLSRFKNITHLYCEDNNLTCLPGLNSNLIYFHYRHNPICEFINLELGTATYSFSN